VRHLRASVPGHEDVRSSLPCFEAHGLRPAAVVAADCGWIPREHHARTERVVLLAPEDATGFAAVRFCRWSFAADDVPRSPRAARRRRFERDVAPEETRATAAVRESPPDFPAPGPLMRRA